MGYATIPASGRGTAYADTVNGSGTPLSSLGGTVGQMAYVASGGSGSPELWVIQAPAELPAVDHSTVESVAGSTTSVWIMFFQLA